MINKVPKDCILSIPPGTQSVVRRMVRNIEVPGRVHDDLSAYVVHVQEQNFYQDITEL